MAEFRRLNEEGKAAKKASLHETDPEDHKRRMLQASVLDNVPWEAWGRIILAWSQESAMASPPCFLLDASGWFCKWLLRRVNRCAWSTPYYFLLFLRIYPKSQIKANGTIVATINVVIRVVTYIVRSPPASYPSKNWFTEEDKYLYIFVSIIGVLGAP